MKVTVSWLRDNYRAFNVKYFNNELPTITTFTTDNCIHRGGVCKITKRGSKNYQNNNQFIKCL